MTFRYESMFKAYDIRGKIPEIDNTLFYLTGKGFVETILKPQNLPLSVYIMFDTREFSEQFSRYLFKGIVDAGGEPIMLGMGSTDMLYAATVMHDCSGIQVTASHNPREWHGMKIVKKPPEMVGMTTGLDKIKQFVADNLGSAISEDLREVSVNEQKREEVISFFSEKVKEIGSVDTINQKMKSEGKHLKIVADCANGAGGVFMPLIQKLYPNIEFIPLYWEPDGTFPNHPADPQNYENLKDIITAIKEHNADFGVAFDGDADRALIIDEMGVPVDGDFLVAAFSSSLLEEYKKNDEWQKLYNPVVVSIQPNSRLVPETVVEHDGTVAVCKQGHTFVKLEMGKYKGIYGGEYSNHHYFGLLKGMDSGAFPVALMVKLLCERESITVSGLLEKWRKNYYITELMNLRISEGQSWNQWKKSLEEAFQDATISYLDGISVYYFDWKFSMRSSNTEPVVRFILETRGKDKREEKVNHIKSILNIAE